MFYGNFDDKFYKEAEYRFLCHRRRHPSPHRRISTDNPQTAAGHQLEMAANICRRSAAALLLAHCRLCEQTLEVKFGRGAAISEIGSFDGGDVHTSHRIATIPHIAISLTPKWPQISENVGRKIKIIQWKSTTANTRYDH